MLGADQIWAAVAISSTSNTLFSATFLEAALGFLPLPIKQSSFLDLGFEGDDAHSRHEGLSRIWNAMEEEDTRGGYLLYRDSTTVRPDNHANGRGVLVFLPF